jgi:parallel beta-helix repeat protein
MQRLSLCGLLLIGLMFGPQSVSAQTLTGETIWQGQVEVREAVRVERGAILRILPGSVVTFHAVGLEVAGTLEARDAVLTGLNWPGLVLKGCDEKTALDGVTVSGAKLGIQVVGGAPRLRNCLLRDNEVGLELRQKSDAQVQDCRFVQNAKVGLFIKDGTTAAVNGNRFEKNDRYAVYIYRASPAQFSENELTANGTAVIVAYAGSDPQLRGNRIYGNRTGIRVERAARPSIIDNDIHDNETGIDLDRRADPLIEANRLDHNKRGVAIAYSSYPQLHGNDFSGNDVAVYLEYQSAQWEKQRGQQARDAETPTRSAFAGQNAAPVSAPAPVRLDGRIDASGNFWGGAATAELATLGADGNPTFIDDGRDRPTFDEGGATWPLDIVIYAPWSSTPQTVGRKQL